METNKFSVVMSEKVDMALVRIVASERADYQPEAVIAADCQCESHIFANVIIA